MFAQLFCCSVDLREQVYCLTTIHRVRVAFGVMGLVGFFCGDNPDTRSAFHKFQELDFSTADGDGQSSVFILVFTLESNSSFTIDEPSYVGSVFDG